MTVGPPKICRCQGLERGRGQQIPPPYPALRVTVMKLITLLVSN